MTVIASIENSSQSTFLEVNSFGQDVNVSISLNQYSICQMRMNQGIIKCH